MNTEYKGLKIRIYKIDGTIENFSQAETSAIESILVDFQPARLFSLGKIAISEKYALTVFAASKVARVDFIGSGTNDWELPPDVADIVELSQDEFLEKVRLSESPQLKGNEPSPVLGDFDVRLLEIELLGGYRIFLAVEIMVGLPAERLNKIHFLLTASALHFRLPLGGVGVVNLETMVRFTVFSSTVRNLAGAWPAVREADAP